MAIQMRMVGSIERYFTCASTWPSCSSGTGVSTSFKSPGAIKPLGRDCRMNCRLIVLTFNGLSSADLKSRFLALPGLRRQAGNRSEEHTSELQSRRDLVCRLLLEKKKKTISSLSGT